jgi:hypothetical protein
MRRVNRPNDFQLVKSDEMVTVAVLSAAWSYSWACLLSVVHPDLYQINGDCSSEKWLINGNNE